MQLSPEAEATIAGVVRRRLQLQTLETRGSDRLDFHELPVWALRAALQEVWEEAQASVAGPLGEVEESGDWTEHPVTASAWEAGSTAGFQVGWDAAADFAADRLGSEVAEAVFGKDGGPEDAPPPASEFDAAVAAAERATRAAAAARRRWLEAIRENRPEGELNAAVGAVDAADAAEARAREAALAAARRAGALRRVRPGFAAYVD